MSPQPAERSQMVAATFDRVAAVYDTVDVPWFRPIAEQLVRELAPALGEKALDIGSGRGAATFPLAEAVGPSGHVTAIDLAKGMVEALRGDVAERDLPQVDVLIQDAANPEFDPQTFDVIASSLVLFFLPEPVKAVQRWHDLLRPGGRIGISTFGDRDAKFLALDEVFTPYLPPRMLDARASGTAGPFASDAGVEEMLTASGFTDVRTAGREIAAVFRAPEHWVSWSHSHGQRAMWSAVPEDRRAEVRAEIDRVLEAARGDDGMITLRQRVRYTLARRP
jgi:ubiquinone/menaquinone biosynthesis C-methylase UbiE